MALCDKSKAQDAQYKKSLNNRIAHLRETQDAKTVETYLARLAEFDAAISEGAITLADWIESEWRPKKKDITLYTIEEWIARFGHPSRVVDIHGRVNGCFATEPDFCE